MNTCFINWCHFLQQSQSMWDVSATVAVTWVFKSQLFLLWRPFLTSKLGNLLYEGCGTGVRAWHQTCHSTRKWGKLMWHGKTLPYIFIMFSVEMCVLIKLPDLLSSSWLYLKLMLCSKGNQNRIPVKCFLFLPRGKSNSHWLNKETLRSMSITTFVFRALFDKGGAKSGHRGEMVHSLGIMEMIALSTHTATTDKSRKKYSTPSVLR